MVENERQEGSWWVQWDPQPRDDFFLIEREVDSAVFDVPADLVFNQELALDRIGEFRDEGDVIQLMDSAGCVVDTANFDRPDREGWSAGSSVPPASMERTDPFAGDVVENWHTNLGAFTFGTDAQGHSLFATPRHENSPALPTVILERGLPFVQVNRDSAVVIDGPIETAADVAAGPPRLFLIRLEQDGQVAIQTGELPATREILIDGVRVSLNIAAVEPGRYAVLMKYKGRGVLLVLLEV